MLQKQRGFAIINSAVADAQQLNTETLSVIDSSNVEKYPSWPKGHPWKGCRSLIAARGFKSLLLRQRKCFLAFPLFCKYFWEVYQVNKLFDADNKLNRFLARVFDCGILSVLWIVCSIPVFTMGASTIAMYTVTLKMVKNEEGAIIRSFFKAFRDNFKQSVPVTLIGIGVYTVLFVDYLVVSGASVGRILPGIVCAAVILFTAVYSYVCPLLAMFDNTVRNTFGNAWKLAVLNPLETGMFVILNLGPHIYFYLRPDHFFVILPLWFLLGPGGLAYIMSIYFRKIFDKLLPKEKGEND